VRELVVVPDGAVAAVPFAALHDGTGYLGARPSLTIRYGLDGHGLSDDAGPSGRAALVVADRLSRGRRVAGRRAAARHPQRGARRAQRSSAAA
jgi:hypothetical protein